jgi:hypothetical protein
MMLSWSYSTCDSAFDACDIEHGKILADKALLFDGKAIFGRTTIRRDDKWALHKN